GQPMPEGAQCYPTKEEAHRNCKTTGEGACWGCVNGKVVKLTAQQVAAGEIQCYPSKEQAQRNCTPTACWVCVKGKVVQLTPAQPGRPRTRSSPSSRPR